jgi:hypothetical protein
LRRHGDEVSCDQLIGSSVCCVLRRSRTILQGYRPPTHVDDGVERGQMLDSYLGCPAWIQGCHPGRIVLVHIARSVELVHPQPIPTIIQSSYLPPHRSSRISSFGLVSFLPQLDSRAPAFEFQTYLFIRLPGATLPTSIAAPCGIINAGDDTHLNLRCQLSGGGASAG